MNPLVCCACCNQWFTFNGNNAIVVKNRGHREKYYCGVCVKQNQISRKGETNEYFKS